ncbi:MAG TPA: hypothetical protein DDZ51_17930 [Planctomycetaceae bacterium]|nr:hypothetical protein [Planctomycetaceae bacterium]
MLVFGIHFIRIRSTQTLNPTPSNDRSPQIGLPPATKWVVAIYAAAVAIRIVLAFTFGSHSPQIVDAQDYDRLAIGLVETGRYSYDTQSGELTSLRPPLYPAMVAVIYMVFGVGSYVAVSLVQSVISLATMVLVHRMGNRLVGPRAGLIAAAIFGFYPSLLAFNCQLLSETLFTFLFTAAVFASLQLQRTPDWRYAVLLGILLGLGALARSILWVCAVPILGFLVLTSAGEFRWRLRDSAIAAFVFVAVLAPWAWRNTRLHQTFTVVDVMGGRNVMMGNYEYTPLERSWATVTDVTGEKAWYRVLAESRPGGLRGLTQGQIDKLAMRYGVKYFFAHPEQSIPRSIVRFFNFWQLDRTFVAGFQKGLWGETSKPALAVAFLAFSGGYAIVALASILGFFTATWPWRIQSPFPFGVNGLLLLWVVLPCAVHTIAFAHSRYHQPLIPIMAIYAAIVVDRLLSKDWPAIRRALLPSAILGAVLVLAWIREILVVDLRLFG